MMLLAINLLGMGLGPLLVGVFSDLFIAAGNESVRYGLALWLVFLLSVPLPMRLVLSPMPMLLQRKRLRS